MRLSRRLARSLIWIGLLPVLSFLLGEVVFAWLDCGSATAPALCHDQNHPVMVAATLMVMAGGAAIFSWPLIVLGWIWQRWLSRQANGDQTG